MENFSIELEYYITKMDRGMNFNPPMWVLLLSSRVAETLEKEGGSLSQKERAKALLGEAKKLLIEEKLLVEKN